MTNDRGSRSARERVSTLAYAAEMTRERLLPIAAEAGA